MFEIIAQGEQLDHRWRRPIPMQEPFLIGRSSSSFRVPWDSRISRNHVRLNWLGQQLLVQRLENTANPVFFNGSQEELFRVSPGEHFVIGNTTFTLTKDQAHVTLDLPNPIQQKTFSPEFLQQLHFRNADQRIDVLNRLPDLISSAGNEQDMFNRLTNTLLSGIPSASTVGIVRVQDSLQRNAEPSRVDAQDQGPEIDIIHWDRRGIATGDFQPSEKLIRQSLASDETVLHVWHQKTVAAAEYTFDLEHDWAFACPISGPATPGWGIYVTGSHASTRNLPAPATHSRSEQQRPTDAEDLQGDIKFCQLVGSTLKNLLLVSRLQRRQASLRSFFSPIVLEALAERDPEEVLKPQQCPVSVLFCDLRGFSRTSEAMADDLFLLLSRVSDSLDVMTGCILQTGGVIGDFHGDSAMGFWGWPLQQTNLAHRAVNAALAIKTQFNSRQIEQPDFQIGIGIATGVAVAGKLGSRDQVKVTVFGPVVNLASRLESLNHWFGSSILVDAETAKQLEHHPQAQDFLVRRLGRFQPFGMETAHDVIQILDRRDGITPATLANYRSALAAFENGDWHTATQQLESLAAIDKASEFLLNAIRQLDGQFPPGSHGVIQMTSK